jgi:hypothetical protein
MKKQDVASLFVVLLIYAGATAIGLYLFGQSTGAGVVAAVLGTGGMLAFINLSNRKD